MSEIDNIIPDQPLEGNAFFFKELVKSIPAQFEVAKWLFMQRRGKIDIYIPRLGTDQLNFVDDGDIIVNNEWVVEAKHRPNLNFTCANDFPFPDKKIIVSNVAPTDRKPKTVMWVILNGPMTHAAIVYRSTMPKWEKKNVWCGNYKRHELKYLVHVDHVKFVELYPRQ